METSSVQQLGRFIGRVACAHVQPVTVKAHARCAVPVFPTSGLGRASFSVRRSTVDRFKKDKNYAEAFKRRQRWQKLGGLKEEEKKGAGWSGLFLGLLAIIVIGALLNSVNSTSTDPRKAEEERRRRGQFR